jgi:hypothetical protein
MQRTVTRSEIGRIGDIGGAQFRVEKPPEFDLRDRNARRNNSFPRRSPEARIFFGLRLRSAR